MEKQCVTCKKAKPLSEFTRHAKAKGGYFKSCKTCMGKLISAGRQKTSEKPYHSPEPKDMPDPPKPKKKRNREKEAFDRKISFYKHQSILQEIEELADREIRSFAGQVVYILRESLKAGLHDN